MMKYDFVLFENLYTVENHYKDLKILAVLLREAGYNVAIADAFKEANLCNVEGIPHISVQTKCSKEFKTLRVYSQGQSRWKHLFYRAQKDWYLYRVLRELKGMAPNIYLGSLTLATPAFFFRAFDRDTRYYMWALRSATLLNWKERGMNFYSWVSRQLYKNVNHYKNLNLIISNKIICDEFVKNAGVERNRIVIRPERIVSEKVHFKFRERKDESLKLLYIGTIRPSKNIEFCLEALRQINDSRIFYTIAGRCRENNDYGEKINQLASPILNVIRIDRYIPDMEYEQLLDDCDFVILCDEKEPSCASNGTMLEALLHGRPIIAPDIHPFKYEIEKYGVGILFQYGSVDSLCRILKEAIDLDLGLFEKRLYEYQQSYTIENVSRSLRQQLGN